MVRTGLLDQMFCNNIVGLLNVLWSATQGLDCGLIHNGRFILLSNGQVSVVVYY